MPDTVTEVRKPDAVTARLVCPICSRPNGFWRLHFKALFESGTSLFMRKRHPRCKVNLLYCASPGTDGKIAVRVIVDDVVKEGIARLFNVSEDAVNEVLLEVIKNREDLGHVEIT